MTNALIKSMVFSGILCGLLATATMTFGMEQQITGEQVLTDLFSPQYTYKTAPHYGTNRTLLISANIPTNLGTQYTIMQGTADPHILLPTIIYQVDPSTLQVAGLSANNFNELSIDIIKAAQKQGRHVLIYENETTKDRLWLVETQPELQESLDLEKQFHESHPNISSASQTKNNAVRRNNRLYILGGCGISLILILIALYPQFFKNLLSNAPATA